MTEQELLQFQAATGITFRGLFGPLTRWIVKQTFKTNITTVRRLHPDCYDFYARERALTMTIEGNLKRMEKINGS